MNHRQRLLESENHTARDVGEIPNHIRRDVEDALVQALEDTHRDGRLNAFRSWLDRWGLRSGVLDQETVALLRCEDGSAWAFVHFATCWCYRMLPRWEHSANRLMHEFGFSPEEIPAGKGALHL